MLQIDVQPIGDAAAPLRPAFFKKDDDREQWIVLRPNFEEVVNNLHSRPSDFKHWDWFEGTAPEYERARGRMALFYDLRNGMDSSLFIGGIRKAFRGLDSPAVRVIGTTFDDISSGMLIDTIRLVQIARGQDVPVQLWLLGPQRKDWTTHMGKTRRPLRPEEQKTRTLATLREMERFERNQATRFNYVPPTSNQEDLRREYNFAVVQGLFIFESRSEQPPEADALACMADALLALLHHQTHDAFIAHFRQTQSEATPRMAQLGGLVNALGCYTVRMPGSELRRVMAWRMVREVLFESALGLASLETLNSATGEYSQQTDEVGPVGECTPAEAAEVRRMVTVARSGGKLRGNQFKFEIALKLQDKLNGEDANQPLLARKGRLVAMSHWLELVESNLVNYPEASDLCEQVRALRDQADAWSDVLKSVIYPACISGCEEARKKLQALVSQPARYTGVDQKLEWPLYQQAVRPWSDKPAQSTLNEPLLRLGSRFGWRINIENEAWTLELLAPPGDFYWYDREDLSPFAYTSDMAKANAGGVLDLLFRLAEPIPGILNLYQAREIASGLESQAWVEKSMPRLDYDELAAAQMMGQVMEKALLTVVKPREDAESILNGLQSVPGYRPDLTLCQTEDRTSVSLMRIVDWIPLKTVTAFNETAWEQNKPPAAMYVWRPEQLAAALESDQRFTSTFVSWLAADRELLESFSLGMIYQSISSKNGFYSIPGLGDVEGQRPGEVLQHLYSSPPNQPDRLSERNRRESLDNLNKAIKERREAVNPQRFVYLKKVEAEVQQMLVNATSPVEKDLARFILSRISSERERRT